jgi:hypothetical protein
MYKVGKYYLVNGKKMLMIRYENCEIDNGEEICAYCHGKAVFLHSNNILEKKCGWLYTRLNNYIEAYSEYTDDL